MGPVGEKRHHGADARATELAPAARTGCPPPALLLRAEAYHIWVLERERERDWLSPKGF
jgi:hypothetical protein